MCNISIVVHPITCVYQLFTCINPAMRDFTIKVELFTFNTPILGVKLNEKSSHLCASLMRKGVKEVGLRNLWINPRKSLITI